MKKEIESAKPIDNEDKLALVFRENELDLNAMNRIRGGEGEDNGGGNIIIIPPFK
jgi:hypothetical protein